MKQTKLIWIIITLSLLMISKVYAQSTETLYYDENWKGVETKEEAKFYRIVNFDAKGKPIGEILDYFITGELQSKIESAKIINRFDDSKSVFIGNSERFSKNGILISTSEYNNQGKNIKEVLYYASGELKAKINHDFNGNGIVICYSPKGIKTAEVIHENYKPKYSWYTGFDVLGNSGKYDLITNKPVYETTETNKNKNFSNSNVNNFQTKECKSYYKDGKAFQYYVHNGISVTMHLSIEKNYGKYYIAYIAIENLTGKEFNFYPSNIRAILIKKGIESDGEVLSSNEYMSKVKSKQAWNAALVAFGESYSANQAGYSTSSTTSTTSGYANSYGSASGYYGNTYGSVYGSSSTYGTATTRSTTKSYDGGAKYAAQQNAQRNISNYQNQQYQIRNVLNQGYLKLNTIFNEQRIVGHINIKYKSSEKTKVIIPVNGVDYEFWWNNK